MAVVVPKTDCPHLSNAYDPNNFSSGCITITSPCSICNDTSENWICLSCKISFCSRFVNRHMLEHFQKENHCIAVSCSDLSAWCFQCDSYIIHSSLESAVNILYREKFGTDPPPTSTVSSKDTKEDYDSKSVDGAADMESLFSNLNLDYSGKEPAVEEPIESPIESLDLQGIAKFIQSDKCKRIIVMTGAGISVSCGIPDFRSPGSGLYHNLQKYNLSSPEDIFSIEFFLENPQPFIHLARELYPGLFRPSPAHYFIKLLQEKGLLLRCFTQNIDGLEMVAGLKKSLCVQAHGGFESAHCTRCKKEYSFQFVKENVFQDKVPTCECNGYVKPDIVFFGEALPSRFFDLRQTDFPMCDLLIVIGTSLKVMPFAGLIDQPPNTTPRLLINNEKVGTRGPMNIPPFLAQLLGIMSEGFTFDNPENKRDVFYQNTCDQGVEDLVKMLGWENEFKQLLQERENMIIGSYSGQTN